MTSDELEQETKRLAERQAFLERVYVAAATLDAVTQRYHLRARYESDAVVLHGALAKLREALQS